MKNVLFLSLGLFLSIGLYAQDDYQQEVICPCVLEFHFPTSMDASNIIQAFGGVPVLRFNLAEIDGQQLICRYSTSFAKFFFDGFGFVISREGKLSAVPYDLTLTMDETFLSNWSPSRKTVKIPSYHRGDVIFTLDAPSGECYSWYGAFYKSLYNGNQITLKRSFEHEARLNNEGTGFITADTQTGLFSPGVNSNAVDDLKKSNQTVTKVNSKEFPKNRTKDSLKIIKKKRVKKSKKKTIK
jgi:hypothetical protein